MQNYPQAAPVYNMPMPIRQLNTNRGLGKFILLSIITLGIYAIVFYYGISEDINLIASKYDGRKTMNYALLIFVVAPLTLGIGAIVWEHNLSNRMGAELARRRIVYDFSERDYWLWNVLGALILVGPFIYIYKLATASNELARHYNYYG